MLYQGWPLVNVMLNVFQHLSFNNGFRNRQLTQGMTKSNWIVDLILVMIH